MKTLVLTTALATVAALAAAPAAAQYTQLPGAKPKVEEKAPEATAQASGPQIKISKKASKAVVALQTAVKANDVANIPARVAEAKAVAETSEDKYAVGQLELTAALAAKNDEAAASAIAYIAASGFLPPAKVAPLYNAIGVNFYNAKNYARAATLFQQAIAIESGNAEALKLLAEAQNSLGKGAEAAATFNRSIQVAEAAGQKPSEDVYKRAVSLAYAAEAPIAIELGRKWVAAYPNPESWRNSIAIYRNLQRPGVEGTLNLLRLMRFANALQSPNDFALYAQAASEQGNYVEAQAVLDEGIESGKITATSAAVADTIKGLKTRPKASLAQVETASGTVKSAKEMITVGNNFYAYGKFDRAADMYRKALGAGADAGLANLHLGMALVRTGDKAGAMAALKAVTGEYAPIAQFWILYAQKAG